MEVIPNVYRLPLGASGVNVYVLLGETLTVVDTGMPGNAGAILDYIRRLGRNPSDVARIVVTHYHVDHIGSLDELKRQTQARVLAHPDDAPVIAGERPQPQPRGALFRLAFRLVPAMSRYTPVPVDTPIQDGETLDVLGGATVVHVPGHTPGSIALYLPTQRLLLTGDAINHRRRRLSGPAAAFTCDMRQAAASIRRMAALDVEVLCPGHGAPLIGQVAQPMQALLQALA